MPEGHTRLHNQWAGHDTGRSDLTIVAWILHDATNCLLFWGCRVIGGVINQVQNVTKNVNVFQTDLYMNPLSETLERTLVPSMRLLTARVFLAKQRSAILNLDEAAVVGNVRDLSEDTGLRRIATRQVMPRIVTQLLDTERNTLPFAIELQDLDVDLVANVDDL